MEGGARGLEGRGGKCPPQADAATPTPPSSCEAEAGSSSTDARHETRADVKTFPPSRSR